MKRSLLVASLVATAIASPGVVLASSLLETRTDSRAPISECISENKKLDVLFVVDQSISLKRTKSGEKRLPGTDPNDERVTALKAVLNVLKSKTNQSEDDSRINVTVAHSGFGTGFNLHQDWTDLDENGFETMLKLIDAQANLDNENLTRYHEALNGIIAAFDSRQDEQDACRMVIWFSDGQHDDDNKSGGFSGREKRQISQEICGENGLADQMRRNGIFVVAAGLSADERELELMKLVSENAGSIPSLNLTKCGLQPSFGKFEVAKNSEALVETLFNLVNTNPGGKDISPTNGEPCSDGTPNCSEIRFKVTDQVKAFTMLVDKGAADVRVELTTGPGQTHLLFDKNGIIDANVTAERISGNKLYLDVQRKKSGTIDGTWMIRFTGEGNESAKALVKFLGAGEVNVYSQSPDGKTTELVSLDRYQTSAIRIDAKTSTTGVGVSALDVTLRAESKESERLETPIVAQRQSDGTFLVSSQFLNDVVNDDEWRRATQAEFVVRLQGEVVGLIDAKTRDNVPVEFDEVVKKVILTNGSKWPTYMPQLAETPRFVGTDKQKVSFHFMGADGRDTVVRFEDKVDEDLGFVFISGQECLIPRGRTTVCVLELKPARDSYGEKDFVASAQYEHRPEGATVESEQVDLPFGVSMRKATDVGDGFRTALSLLLVFLLIQGLQRFFFAWLMTRYSPLSTTCRRVRLDVTVDASGHVNINKTDISSFDESFTFENHAPSTQFDAFSYLFRCSSLRSFLHSTTSPQGIVLNHGRHVIGSSGTVVSRKDSLSTGLVDLSLRNQWVIGIDESEAFSLAGGSLSVPAEMVVFLEPYEIRSRTDQLSELEFSIASGNLGQSVTVLLENLRAKSTTQSDVTELETDVFSSGFDSATQDPWGIADPIEDGSKPTKKKPSRRRRSKTNPDDGPSASSDFVPPSDDPFA